MSNHPSSSKGDQDQNDDTDFQRFRDELRTIQGRIEKTAVVGESLQSTEHELQLHLQALSARSRQAYDPSDDAKASELSRRIANLSRQSDELSKDSNLISRPTEQSPDIVSEIYYFPPSPIFLHKCYI